MEDNVYITSDLHFYHKNIIKYCPKFRKDFQTLEEMNEHILSQIDELPAGSILINNGDLYLNSSKSFEDIKPIIDRMKSNNKELWIIMGNHDREMARYMKHAPSKASREILYKLGFDRVYEFPILIEEKYLLSHEPVYLHPNSNIINVYGHTHDLAVDEDYFNRDCENWAMMERVKKEGITSQTNLDIDTSIKDYHKKITLSNYKLACWDAYGKIMKFNDLVSNNPF